MECAVNKGVEPLANPAIAVHQVTGLYLEAAPAAADALMVAGVLTGQAEAFSAGQALSNTVPPVRLLHALTAPNGVNWEEVGMAGVESFTGATGGLVSKRLMKSGFEKLPSLITGEMTTRALDATMEEARK
jgi:hypothetical protein